MEARMIRLASPSWLLLAPAMALAVYWVRSWRTPLRLGCMVLFLLLLVDPQIRRLGHGLDLWVLEDQSASADEEMTAHRREIESLLSHSAGPADRIFYIDYASHAQVRGEADEITPQQKQSTRTNLAIQLALARMSPDRAARILLVTDGYSTEPLSDAAERLNRQEVALDYRLLVQPDATAWRVMRVDLPPKAQTGEPFMMEVELAGEPDGTAELQLLRDGARIGLSPVPIKDGKATVRFTDRLMQTGAHRYAAEVVAAGDAHSRANRMEKWIEIAGGPRVLLITAYPDDPIAPVLRAQGFDVEVVTDPAAAQVGQLSGAKVVILNNVPAHLFHQEFLNAIDFYVRSQGGGLLMAGGRQSFGSGGYFESAVDSLLPVSMELRTEQRKLATAMSIVLDRSGSMAASIGPNLEKIDLADEGTARSIELLGPLDAVSVYAVDTEAHEIVPLTGLGSNRAELEDTVRRITSGGGGIYVPTGLRAAWNSLKPAQVGQRHVVLFADANDATQELADYKTLIPAMVKDGITISVIGLGKETDSGGAFLKEVAQLGNGRIFFNANPSDLPAVFAQDTVAVARSAFIDKPVTLTPATGWLAIAARPLPWLDAVDGYNLSYLKPEATAAAFSADDYKAPLVAFWQRGAGRAAAVSFPLGGDYSGAVRNWRHYADFLQTLTRWLSGEQLPPGLGLKTHLDGSELRIDLYYDDSWEQRLAEAPPRLMMEDEASLKPREVTWQRLAPGHFSAVTELTADTWVRGAVQTGGFTLPFGPLVAGSSLEWTFDKARLLELEGVARATGGVERLDLTKIWQAPRRAEFYDPRNILLTLLLIAFVLDALASRMFIGSPAPAASHRRA
jgi:hypothetical protein